MNGRLVIARNHLLPALAVAGKVADRKNTIPILNNVLLDSDGETLRVVGTNLDQELTASAPLVAGDVLKSTLPSQLLHDAVKSLPESAEVGIDLDRQNATVSSGKARFRMPVLPASDFPSISQGNLTHTFEIDAAELQDMLGALSHAVSTRETDVFLNGVYLHADAGDLIGVATDRHRLSRWRRKAPDGAEGMPGIILPRQALALVRSIVGDKGAIKVSLSDVKILFESAAGSLLTKLVDGIFPDYQRIIPDNPHRFRVKRSELAAAVARVLLVETIRGSAVKFGFGIDGALTMTSLGDDRSAGDEIACVTESDSPIEIGLGGRYTADMLAATDAEELEYRLADRMSPATVEPVGSDRQLFVIMPMRV